MMYIDKASSFALCIYSYTSFWFLWYEFHTLVIESVNYIYQRYEFVQTSAIYKLSYDINKTKLKYY